MRLEGSININTLITAGTILVSGALAYASLDKRITILEQLASERSVRVEKQIEELRAEVHELSKVLRVPAKEK
jgi:hypothetical protein